MQRWWRILLTVWLLGAGASASGCSAYQAFVQRQAIARAHFALRGFYVEGFDLAGVNVLLTLTLANPTDTPIVLDRLDYTLYVDERRALTGYSDQRLEVPAHDERPFTLHCALSYADLGDQIAGALHAGGRFDYRLVGVGHFDTPLGTIDYPLSLNGS